MACKLDSDVLQFVDNVNGHSCMNFNDQEDCSDCVGIFFSMGDGIGVGIGIEKKMFSIVIAKVCSP